MEDKKIDLKKELVEKAKELAEKAEGSDLYHEVAELKKKWKRTLSEEESLLEKELSDQYEKYMAIISEKTGDVLETVEERKTAIIEEAKKILDSKNFKQASIKMDELMESWKHAGRAAKEKDDELWAQFKELRNEFFANRKAYYTQLRETFAKNKEEKEKIIEEAIAANEGSNFKEIGAKMDELMESWKKLGHAGKDHEEDLWAKFKEQRTKFFKNRKADYEGMKETYAKRTEDKKALIAEAKLYLARSEFSQDEINAVKELRTRWKEIGSAGRENEDTLWEEFNSIINKYYDNMKFYKSKN